MSNPSPTNVQPYPSASLLRMLQPGPIVILSLIIMCALGWAVLLIMVAGLATDIDLSEAGPGMAVLESWFVNDATGFARALYLSLCAPGIQAGSVLDGAGSWGGLALFVPMWLAMALAMMLPAVSPMLMAYLDITETARAKQIATISPFVLLAGYLVLWGAFCLVAALAQWQLARYAYIDNAGLITNPVIAAGILAMAGAYQLSPLKLSCLMKCRSPMPYLMTHWSHEARSVFKMGLDQGLICLACCWALMVVMFAAGLMNLVWMVILTILMLLEKLGPNPKLMSRLTGAFLLVWSVGVLSRIWL